MTWAEVKRTLTTPPPVRPPPPKHPMFTKDFFSTKSFGPGHLVGAGVLVFSLYGLTKYFVGRGRAEAERVRQLAEPTRPVRRPEEDATKVAQTENQRGQYGKRP